MSFIQNILYQRFMCSCNLTHWVQKEACDNFTIAIVYMAIQQAQPTGEERGGELEGGYAFVLCLDDVSYSESIIIWTLTDVIGCTIVTFSSLYIV